jgi:hypothetical protein
MSGCQYWLKHNWGMGPTCRTNFRYTKRFVAQQTCAAADGRALSGVRGCVLIVESRTRHRPSICTTLQQHCFVQICEFIYSVTTNNMQYLGKQLQGHIHIKRNIYSCERVNTQVNMPLHIFIHALIYMWSFVSICRISRLQEFNVCIHTHTRTHTRPTTRTSRRRHARTRVPSLSLTLSLPHFLTLFLSSSLSVTHVHMCVCKYIHTHTCICIYLHTNIYICPHTCNHTRIHMYTMHTYAYECECEIERVGVCTCACTRVWWRACACARTREKAYLCRCVRAGQLCVRASRHLNLRSTRPS